jgi:hypothetical protein
MSTVTIPRPAVKQRLVDAQSEVLLQRLVTSTPAQIESWLLTNVTNISQARTVLKALAIGLRHLYLQGN